MEILEIRMKHFGKFTEQNMAFHSGVNVIYGENETGKSTMHSFIRGMLYGIGRMRGRAAKNDEYSLRRPWENGSYFAGSMRFESGGEIYRIDRNFDAKEKEVRLYCEGDGRELAVRDGVLEPLPDGMTENAFCNTVFISQHGGETDEGLAISVRNFMVNAQSGGLAEVDVKKAMEYLQKERKSLEKRKKQQVTERVEKSQEIHMRMDYISQELEELRGEEHRCRAMLGQLAERDMVADGSGKVKDSKDGKSVFYKAGKIAMAVLAVIALAVALVTGKWETKVICAGVILLSCLGVWCFAQLEKRREAQRAVQDDGKELAQRRKEQEKRQTQENERRKLIANLEWILASKQEKERALQELEEQYLAIQMSGEKENDVEESLSAVYLAIDTLEEVTAEIYEEYAQKLNERASDILGQITGGQYTSIFLDECLQVKIYTMQGLLEIEQVSKGTMEQIYFALRMAAAELMSPQEPMPILLDDAFAAYDNTRLEHTLRWLCSCGHQVLLFTCQNREQEILQKIYAE